MKPVVKKKLEDFYKLFKPQLTPKNMLEMGVFGGSYFGGKIKEYPKSWFKNAKLSKTFDVEKNRFRVKAGLTRKEWLDKGWIFKEDPLGWFQWFCRFKNGRRIPEIDQIQIKRWKAFGDRHVPASIRFKASSIIVSFCLSLWFKDRDKSLSLSLEALS